MKKKIISLCLVVCLLATAIVGGTLAYFTDTDSATNVMTLGNVKIVQNEEQRPLDDEGQPEANFNGLVDFEQGKPMYPLIKNVDEFWETDRNITDTDGKTPVGIWDTNMNNEIDKFVSVTNKGTEDAYVRTILLFETVRSYKEDSSTEWVDLHNEFLLISGDYDYLEPTEAEDINQKEGVKDQFTYVTIGDKEYVVAVKTYDEALEPGKTTTSSLRQFALSWEVGNDVYDFFGPTYEILALSQAVQTAGFTDVNKDGYIADDALNTAFGEVNDTNVAAWFAGSTGVIATPATEADRPVGYVLPDVDGDVVVNGVTVIDNSDEKTNLRALFNGRNPDDYVNGNLIITGCYLDGTYAMNVYGDGTGHLTVSDTDLRGWVSYTGFKSAEFTNCTFGVNTNAETYNNIRPYSDITFTDCEFDGTTFWLDKLPSGAKVTFVNCTMNGVAITAATQIDVDEGAANVSAIVIG